MLSKNDIKLIKSLGMKKYREQERLFVVEGEKMVAEALCSGLKVRLLVLGREWADTLIRHNTPSPLLNAEGIRTEHVTQAEMERMTLLSSPSPALAVLEMPNAVTQEQVDALLASRPFCLALDSVRDPGNLGTILRIADWFGIDAIFASYDTVDIYNPKSVQSTMGALFRRHVIRCDIPEIAARFRKEGMEVYGTFLDGRAIYEAELCNEGLVVMGSESFGISDAVAAEVSSRITIPSFPADAATSESLNVAVATAITCSEFRRRISKVKR